MKIDLKITIGLLAVIGIHCFSLFISSLSENLWGALMRYEFLPWTRLFVLAIELPIIMIVLNRVSITSAIDNKDVLKLLTLTVITIILSQCRNHFEPTLTLCGFSMLDGTAEIMLNDHWENTFRVKVIETIMIITALIYYTLLKIKANTSY